MTQHKLMQANCRQKQLQARQVETADYLSSQVTFLVKASHCTYIVNYFRVIRIVNTFEF